MGCSWRPAALLALAMLLPAASAAAPIRGLDPALVPRYQPTADGKFACLDGKKTIPFSQVNDDYCDCLDGSDEPGTSACPNGRFYCANKFFLPLLLNASMVDDGVCDCCDGSDEPAGRCPNNCYDKGMESLADLRTQVRAAEAGVAARNKYIADAVGIKAKWGERKQAVGAELEARRAEKDKAEAEKAKLEEQQKALRDQKHELEDKKAKLEQQGAGAAAGADQGGEAAADGAADGGAVDAGVDGAAAAGETEEEAAARAAAEADAAAEAEARAAQDAADAAAAALEAEGGAAEADAAAGQAAKSEEELAKERMAQWIPGAKDQPEGGAEEAAATAGEGSEEQPAAEGADADQAFREDGEHGGDAAAGGSDAGAGGEPGAAGEEGWAEPAADGAEAGAGSSEASEAEAEAGAEDQPPASAFGKARLLVTKVVNALLHPRAAAASGEAAKLEAAIAKLEARIAALDKQLEPVRSRESTARDKVRDLEKEQRDLTTKLEGSYGDQDVFVPLVDKCFKAQVDKYTYEVCPYSKAAQKEGHSSTSLGTWAGLEENGTRMAFKAGAGCWQGPARSIMVTLLCGKREHLAHVAEPSRCEYTADLETPAACTPDTAAALQAELRKRQQLLGGGAEADAEAEAAAAAAEAAAAAAEAEAAAAAEAGAAGGPREEL